MPKFIPPEIVASLVQTADIIEVIGNRVDLTKDRRGKEHIGLCPFHADSNPSLTVNREKGLYWCWACQEGGTALDFLMKTERITFPEACEELSKITGIEIPKTEQVKAEDIQKERLKQLNRKAMDHFIDNLGKSEKAKEYLKTRGIDEKTAKEFSIGFDDSDGILKKFGTTVIERNKLLRYGLIKKKKFGKGYEDYFRDRITFPIRDNNGGVLGFAGRIRKMDYIRPKYLNSPETQIYKKKQVLYGMFEAHQSLLSSNEAIVVEGYTDVIALSKAGLGNSLATGGTAITDTQINNVFKFADKIIFCFDGDDPGKIAAWKACKLCLLNTKANKEAHFLILPENQDPDEMIKSTGPEPFKKLLKNATPLSDFFIATIKDKFDMSSPEGINSIAENGMETVNKMKDGIYKDKLIEKIAGELEIKVSRLEELKLQYRKNELQRTASKRRKTQSKSKPSLIRQAIKILMHYPELAREISESKEFKHIHEKGIAILKEIITLIQSNESIKLATIIEHFNDQIIKKQLKSVQQEKLILSQMEAKNELHEIVLRLNERNTRSELKELVSKAKDNVLTESQRKRFLALSKSIEIK